MSWLPDRAAFDAGAVVPVHWRNPYEHAYADKAMVSLRFDDADPVDETVATANYTRALPVGLAVHSGAVDATGKLTAAQLLTAQRQGHEIMAHSKTHGTGPANDTAFLTETVGSAEALRALGFNVQTFTQPGTWNNAAYSLNADALYQTAHGRQFMANFLGAQGYRIDDYGSLNNNSRPIPVPNRYGARPTSADGQGLSALQAKVERAIASKASIELFWHLRNADVTNIVTPLMTWLRTQRDAGLLDVVTPGYALNAKPGTPINLCPEGDFAAMNAWRTANPDAAAAGTNGGTNWSGTPVNNPLQPGRAEGRYAIRTTSALPTRWVVNGVGRYRSLLLTGWVKSADGTGACQPRGLVTITGGSQDAPARFADGAGSTETDAATWRRVDWLIGIPPGADKLELVLYAFSGSPVWTDLTIRPV